MACVRFTSCLAAALTPQLLTLVKHVVNTGGGLATPDQWTLTADGGVRTFGDASFHGSIVDLTLNAPVTGIGVRTS